MRPAGVVLLWAVLASPGAWAGWSAFGATEPDTPWDTFQAWPGPDPSPMASTRIYFSGFLVQSTGFGGFNPNLALDEGRLAPWGRTGAMAILGVWTDCNRDGHVGAAATALWAYHEGLLAAVEESPCASGGPHRPSEWVHEFRWIAPLEPDDTSLPLAGLSDLDARIWGDFGPPGAPAPRACPQYPMPPGASSTTGGWLGHVDCHVDHAVATTLSEEDPTGRLAFEDPHRPGEDCNSLLQVDTHLSANPHRCTPHRPGMLSEDTDQPAFTVWDCDAEEGRTTLRDPTAPEGERGDLSALLVEDPTPGHLLTTDTLPWFKRDPDNPDKPGSVQLNLTNQEGEYVATPAPAPAVHDPYGSWIDALEHTENGITYLQRPPCQGNSFAAAAVAVANPAPLLERSTVGIDLDAGKRRADFPFKFTPGMYGASFRAGNFVPTNLGEDVKGVGKALNDVAWRTPFNLGLTHVSASLGGGWASPDQYSIPNYHGATIRRNLEAAGGVHATFHARLGPGTLALFALPPGAGGVYGAEACQGHTTGTRDGWDCNRAHWWNPDLGGSGPPPGTTDPRPGDLYHLRDVDCYDGSLPLVGVQASLAVISTDGPCPPPFAG